MKMKKININSLAKSLPILLLGASSAFAEGKDYSGQNLSGQDLAKGEFSNANFSNATLTGTNFLDAVITNANFSGTVAKGFTQGQFESTKSYKENKLGAINLSNNDLTGWSFRNKSIGGSSFANSIIKNTDFSGIYYLSEESLYSTASYKNKDLGAINFSNNRMGGWNFSGQNMSKAAFANGYYYSTDFSSANISGGNLSSSNFTDAKFSNATLTSANFEKSTLTGATFTDAIITHANLSGATSNGFTKEQFYSTASYKNNTLGAINLSNNDMTGWNFDGKIFSSGLDLTNAIIKDASFSGVLYLGGPENIYLTKSYKDKDLGAIDLSNNKLIYSEWNFSGQNMAGAKFVNSTLNSKVSFDGANLSGANFTGATLVDVNINNANLSNTVATGFTKEQFESTASYKNNTLGSINLSNNNLDGWNFADKDINASDMTDAVITNADFSNTNMSVDLITSTKSFNDRNLAGVKLNGNNMEAWGFDGFEMTGASFNNANMGGGAFIYCKLTNASFENANLEKSSWTASNITDAVIKGANLSNVKNFSREQFESTASFKNKDLGAINLSENDMRGWNFDGQDLRSAVFTNSKLDGANMSNANMSGKSLANMSMNGADLSGADLSNAKFTSTTEIYGAAINGANLSNTVANGLTRDQFMGTRSYLQKNLGAVNLSGNNLTAWNFAAQNMAGANLDNTDLSNATFNGATLAGATLKNAKIFNTDFDNVVWTVAKRSMMGVMALSDSATTPPDKWWENPSTALTPPYSEWAYIPTYSFYCRTTYGKKIMWNHYYDAEHGTDFRYDLPDGKYDGQTPPVWSSADNQLWFGEYSGGIDGSGAHILAGHTMTFVDSSMGIDGLFNITMNKGDGAAIRFVTGTATLPGNMSLPTGYAPKWSFEDGAKLNLNILGDFVEGEEFNILVASFGGISVAVSNSEIWENKDNIDFKINGVDFEGTWDAVFRGDGFHIEGIYTAVPEPATCAAILGALALGLSLWRRRNAR